MMRTFQGREFTAYFTGTVEIFMGEVSGLPMIANAGSAISLRGGNILECPGDGPNDAPILKRDERGRIL